MTPLTIACAVDFSDCSRRAFRYAGALAEHFGAHLHVIHVIEAPVKGGPPGRPDPSGRGGLERLLDFVSQEMPHVTQRSGRLAVDVRQGHPAREVLKYVNARRADLVVMGSHGRRDLQAPFFGSTTAHALRRSPIPVLAVPLAEPGESGVSAPLIRWGPILSPTDFSPASATSGLVARGIAAALSVPLLLVHVVPKPGPAAASEQWTGDVADRDPHTLMADLVASLEGVVPLESLIQHGHRARGIAAVTLQRDVSLIVMSLKGGAARGRHKPGMIAYQVMCVAPVPVLALPLPALHAFASHSASEEADSRQRAVSLR
jgi:nucleotide-binding universal stress UspA family protein